jgi:hypothetical protein
MDDKTNSIRNEVIVVYFRILYNVLTNSSEVHNKKSRQGTFLDQDSNLVLHNKNECYH